MKIYSSGGEVILDVIVDDNSYRNRAIMGDHSVVLYFALPTFTEIPVGAYIDYQGERYTLERPEALKMKHSRNFEYTVTLEAYQTRAERWIFRNTVDARITFPLTAKPIEHLQMFVDNMNRRDSGWTVGECIDGAEKLISYDKLHCLEALQQMATTFDTEYEIVGKTVSLHKVEYNRSAPLALSYGRGNGFLPDIGRSNSGDSMPVEILFVAGGEDNIDPSTYGSAALLLPKGQTLRFDGTHFEDEEGFDSGSARGYITSADGLSLRRSDRELSSMAEDCLDCSDISPKRTGTVGQVIVVDADKNFYDFTDSNPASDPCPNFEDYLIEGETMTVIFQSGMLSGRELEVKYIHEAKTERGVAKLGRRFELVPQEIDGETMPNDTYKPAAGDTYAVFHCAMPQAYICDNASKSGASWDMFRAGVKYMYENEDTKFTFSGTLDGIWAKKDWLNIGGKIILGGYVQFTDERFQKDPALVRITGVKDYINKPHSPEITLSNETVSGGFSSTVKTLEAQEVVIDDKYAKSVQFTKRRFRDAQETAKMLEEAMLNNYTSAVSPISVRTMSLLVGDESLQFRFVDNRTNPSAVAHSVTFDNDTMKLTADAGLIQHLTLGISSLSSSHMVSEYRFWSVGAFTSAVLTDTAQGYYLYIKAARDSDTATFHISPTAIGMTDVDGYYFFLVGILNSEYNGERSFVTLYGYTEILPGRITTNKIVSSDGLTYFDLVSSVIGGNIKFRSTSGAERNVNSLEADIDDAAEKADVANATLTSWANDGKISPTEKTGLKQTLSDIQADYPEVVSRCEHYGVSHAEFDVIYTNAVTALKKYTAATPPVIDIGSDYDNIALYWTYRKQILLAINNSVYSEYSTLRSDIDDAAADAASALAEANAAQAELDSWADDGNVGPAEKPALLQMKTQIQEDYTEIIDRCDKYEVAHAEFDVIYTNAIAALNKYSSASPEVITIASDYDNIGLYWTARTLLLKKVNTAVKSYADTLVDNAVSDLSTAITEGDSEAYAKSVAAIETFGETIIKGGHIITDLIDTDALNVKNVTAGEADENGMITGQRVEIRPETKKVSIFDADGDEVQILEGNSYTEIAKLFGGASGTLAFLVRTKYDYGAASGVSYAKGTFTTCIAPPGDNTSNSASYSVPLTTAWQTATPTEVTLGGGAVNVWAKAAAQSSSQSSSPALLSSAGASLYLRILTYSDSACATLIETVTLASAHISATYEGDGTTTKTSSPSWAGKKAKVTAGYHKVVLYAEFSAYVAGSQASASWGNSTILSALSYNGDFYVSRYFANGFCLGASAENYLFAYRQATGGMRFIMANNGYMFDFSNNGIIMEYGGFGVKLLSSGIKMRHNSGIWTSPPLFVAKFRVTCTYANSVRTVTVNSRLTWNGVALTSSNFSYTTTGTVKFTFPSAWSALGLTDANMIINATGYKSGTEYSKVTLYSISSTGFTIYFSDDNSLNDNMAADITIQKIST